MTKETNLIIKQIPVGPMGNFAYLIGAPSVQEAAVVDPGWDTEKIAKEAEALHLKITKIFLTHAHFDHARGVKKLVERTGAKVYVHKTEVDEMPVEKRSVIETDHEQVVELGELRVQFFHTPGHTEGSQCILVEGNIFTGDTLFVGNCGRTDLPTSSPEKMYDSMQFLASLPDETIVYPGHDYGSTPTSTIGREKRENPCMRSADFKEFLGVE